MGEPMTRLAAFLGRRRRWVLAGWVIVLVLALPLASRQTEHLTGGGFDVPGSQSKAVSDALEQSFGEDADGIVVLLQAQPGTTPAARAAAVARVRRAVAGLHRVTLPPAAARRAEVALRHGAVAMLPLRSDLSSDLQIDQAGTLRDELDPGAARGGVTTYLAGQPTIWAGMQELSKEDLSKAEAGGFPIVALILLVIFGSLAAAALPLALGFVSVIVTGALIYFISLNMETSVFVTNMASMIGIGVAIDYSLFILARYREERRAGRSEDEARSEALATSGLAVTFSGLAVMISLGRRLVSSCGVSPGNRWKSANTIARSPAGPTTWTLASSAASATHMSDGCVAMQASLVPRIACIRLRPLIAEQPLPGSRLLQGVAVS